MVRTRFLRVLSTASAIALFSVPLPESAAQQPPTPGCPAADTSSGRECVVHVDLGRGLIGAGAFTPNSNVRFEVFESSGGALLFGPITKRTDSTGLALVSFDVIAPGNYVTVTDLATSIVKTLIVPPLRIDAVDLSGDTVSGTSNPGDQLTVSALGIDSAVLFVDADETGHWIAEFGTFPPQGFDVNATTVVSAGVSDADGDTTNSDPPPGCPAVHPGQTCRIEVTIGGGFAAFGFTPNSPVRFEIYESEGGSLIYGPVTVTTDRTGRQQTSAFGFIDVVPGNYAVVTDLATSVAKSLVATPLSIQTVNVDTGTISGSARPGDEVYLFTACTFPLGKAITDSQGLWSITVSSPGFGCSDLRDSFLSARVYDADYDAITAHPEPGCPGTSIFACITGASIEGDAISVLGFEPESEVVVEVFESPSGEQILGPLTMTTNNKGDAFTDFGLNPGPDIVPGTYVVATDVTTGTVKTNEVIDLSIDRVDPSSDVVEGHAPPGVTVSIEAARAPRNMDATADASGVWRTDFSLVAHDITLEDWFLATAQDEDGDFTNDVLGSPIPGCVDDANTACGSAGPDTIREDEGEVIAGHEDDTTLIGADEGTDVIDVDLGTGDDAAVIDPSKRHRFLTSLMPSFAAKLLPVTVIGGSGSDRVILPTHVADLQVKVSGGGGNDLVELRALGGKNLSEFGRYLLIGGAGADELRGADGDDILEGGGGTDVLRGGKGFDVCYATGADQTFSCERVINKRHR
jgi:Ca2+-binding RTX toxin-like protein